MLKQKLILSYSSQIVLQVFQIVASIVVARLAGPTVLGTVAFGTAYVSVFMFIADLGMSTAHIKLVSEGRDAQKCVTTFAWIKMTYSLLYVLAVVGFFFVQKYVFHKEFESQVHEYVIWISLVTVTVNQLVYIPKTTFAANTEQAKIDIPDLIGGFLLQPLRVVVVLLGFGAVALSFSSLASSLIVVPIYLYLFREYKLGNFDWSLAKEYFRLALPVILIGASTSILYQIDKVLLQFFSSSEQVGYYTAGYRIGGFILLIGKSIRTLFFPLFSKAIAEGNRDYIQDKVEKFERFSFLFIMPAVILAAIFSKTIVLITLGDGYEPSIPVMQLITVTMFFAIINIPYGSVIDGQGKFNLSAAINVFNLVLYVALIVLFVSPVAGDWGAVGLSYALLISTVLIGFVFRYYATRSFPVLNHIFSIKFLVFGIIVYGLSYEAFTQFFDHTWWLQGIFVVLFLGVVYGAMALLGWIDRKDWHNLLEVANVKLMKKYITGEFRNATKNKKSAK